MGTEMLQDTLTGTRNRSASTAPRVDGPTAAAAAAAAARRARTTAARGEEGRTHYVHQAPESHLYIHYNNLINEKKAYY
jgi:hypothetical protein